MKDLENFMELIIPNLSENESFCRVVVASFAARLNPVVEEINELKTAVSEAVTNSILHAYEEGQYGKIIIKGEIEGNTLKLIFEDQGKGIEDLEKAKEPLYTTRPELERSGMGFTIMESFMNEVEVSSTPGKGTTVKMKKTFTSSKEN